MADQLLGVLQAAGIVIGGLIVWAVAVLPLACAIGRRLRSNQPPEVE